MLDELRDFHGIEISDKGKWAILPLAVKGIREGAVIGVGSMQR
jgi:hypothetical protein